MIGVCNRCGGTWDGSEESINEPVIGHGVLCPPCYRGVHIQLYKENGGTFDRDGRPIPHGMAETTTGALPQDW